ncbi:unnamed protein product [Blepharisma stoltei]|uniref:DNA-directed RNA polymerase subunit beta n=1 Tax=Blepharisma stoltei TaxID=1481888 RepID=A0AAU9IN19_9CILI|nr:unnamed protein product [Blepharisma stoltei]
MRKHGRSAQDITQTHIDSFDYAMTEGLLHLCERLLPCEIEFPENSDVGMRVCKIWFENLHLGRPYKAPPTEGIQKEPRLFPTECRLSDSSYAAPLVAQVAWQIDNLSIDRFKVNLGNVPVMVKSEFCHLSKMNQEELIKLGEDIQELGGYFIVNGVEKIIRLLIIQKQNYPLAIVRGAFTNRGKMYTQFAVVIRCVRDDLFTQSVTVHYLTDGDCNVRFILRRGEVFIPAIIILKCLKDITDLDLYNRLVRGSYSSNQTYSRVEVLIRTAAKLAIFTRESALKYLGSRVRKIMNPPSYMADEQVGELVLREHVFVHTDNDNDKFNLLVLMIEKLYALAENEISPESADVLSSQEFLLPGHLYLNIMKENLENTLESVKVRILKEAPKQGIKIRDKTYIQKILEQHANIGKKLEYFLATGNLISRTGLDLMQAAGFTIIAEKINYARYLSHFQSVHRGSYFIEMKISSVRKLLPESWGFLCPVHTPDGAPCGLLNHLSSTCVPVSKNLEFNKKEVIDVCHSLGMRLMSREEITIFPVEYIPVMLDGCIIGYTNEPEEFEKKLRLEKIRETIPRTMEIAYLSRKPLFLGIFLATTQGRLVRPVRHIETGEKDWIGPLEQLNLSIACLPKDRKPETSHEEFSPLNMLSILACTTPFSDHNQSPRNMYQCQMAKQTMGTPLYNYQFRNDNKLYRLTMPQKPLVSSKCRQVRRNGFEKYPSGTNAVVAVISYTGYDMEDAMIVNKSAYERGFGHGIVYKANIRDLNTTKKENFSWIQSEAAKKEATEKGLDTDGLPFVGQNGISQQPELLLFNGVTSSNKTFSYKDMEKSTYDDIKIIGTDTREFKVNFKYRFQRNPIIGDKFSSRHGQKGVLSVLWPQEDMPFTEEGLTPDVIINPHAFPSRMTIGMLIESMAGKVGAIKGEFQEAAPFQEKDKVDYFGKQLLEAGYSYYGSETMYSGIFGTEMKAEIFLGVVYYQRLRHMVADKYQARSTGPVDILTHQPVKGRKRHGGIRLGEMERDSLLGHGASFLLYDRLMKCSDYSEGYLCKKCGSILGCYLVKGKEKAVCHACQGEGVKVALPYVLRYLSNELAAMNIKLGFKHTL